MKRSRHVFELFPLTLPLQLSTPHGVLRHLPKEAFFEFEEAPFLRERLVTSIQAEQQEIGQHRQSDRAAHAFGLLGAWHLPQMEAALELLSRQFHTPTPRVYTENRPCARLGEIGRSEERRVGKECRS